MTSEIDSDSSSSSSSKQERKRRILHKKLKKKTEKKHKKLKKKSSRKEKKTHRQESEKICNKYQNPKSQVLQAKSEQNVNEDAEVFGPALPQHLLNIPKETERNQPSVIGPVIPKDLAVSVEESQNEDDDLQSFYGPLPVTNEIEMTPAQIELEQRALQLKMAAIDGSNPSTSNQNVREEWMLELPDVGLKSGLAALHNLKRGFHQGKEKPDFSDRTSWTKTPNSGEGKPKSSKDDLASRAQALYAKQRDEEQELIAKKHKKKHKRKESLVEIHQKKLHKEEKRKAKELKESGLKPERRPFTRDVDLKLNKIDRNQTKQIVDKAKILNTKFSSGHTKYL